jgi:hypothetical protein
VPESLLTAAETKCLRLCMQSCFEPVSHLVHGVDLSPSLLGSLISSLSVSIAYSESKVSQRSSNGGLGGNRELGRGSFTKASLSPFDNYASIDSLESCPYTEYGNS